MRLWSGFHHEGKIPVIITVEYDDDLDLIVVEVTRGFDSEMKTFTPAHEPADGLMHISDVDHSVKYANIIIKEMKRKSSRRKK